MSFFKNSENMDSPLRRYAGDDSTGYSTDYSTFEISRQTRSSSPVLSRNTLPGQSFGDGNDSPRKARSSLSNHDREECRELLGANASAGLALNSHMATVGDDANEREDEKEERDVMRDDPQCCPTNVNCSLIPSCVIHRWGMCRMCYIVWIGILLIALAITTGVGVFWGVEIFKYRSGMSETVDLATSGSYNVTSEFPLSNIYGNDVCISFEKMPPTFNIVQLSYVSMISKSCSDLTMTIRNESLSKDSPLQYNSYMFHWLRGTTVRIHAIVNGTSVTDVITIYLLNDRISENYCSMHLQPENIVEKWIFDFSNCNLNYDGYLDCYLQSTITSSATYYICINSSINVLLSYDIFISSVIYNTSESRMSLECTLEEDCCLPFDSLISEALHPTCMYITTQALSPDYLGMKLVDVNIQVVQRLSVIKYCFILLLVLLFLIGVIVIFFLLTRYKAEHPNINTRGCTVHCNVYGKDEKHAY